MLNSFSSLLKKKNKKQKLGSLKGQRWVCCHLPVRGISALCDVTQGCF